MGSCPPKYATGGMKAANASLVFANVLRAMGDLLRRRGCKTGSYSVYFPGLFLCRLSARSRSARHVAYRRNLFLYWMLKPLNTIVLAHCQSARPAYLDIMP